MNSKTLVENENLSFLNRLIIKSGFWISILLSLLLIFIISKYSNFNHWLIWIIVLSLLINDFRKSIIKSKDYITKISLTEGIITINYYHIDKEKTIQVLLQKLFVHRTTTQLFMDKYLTTKLNFKIDDQLILCQYKIGKWSEDKMLIIEKTLSEN